MTYTQCGNAWPLIQSGLPILGPSGDTGAQRHDRGAFLVLGLARVERPGSSPLFGREGSVRIDKTDAGGFYATRAMLEPLVEQTISSLAGIKIEIVVSGANGTFIDAVEVASDV